MLKASALVLLFMIMGGIVGHWCGRTYGPSLSYADYEDDPGIDTSSEEFKEAYFGRPYRNCGVIIGLVVGVLILIAEAPEKPPRAPT